MTSCQGQPVSAPCFGSPPRSWAGRSWPSSWASRSWTSRSWARAVGAKAIGPKAVEAGCFITHPLLAPPERLLRTKSIYDSLPCRNRTCPLAQRPHYAVAAWWGCVFAPLCQYVSESKPPPEIAELNRGCRNAARISTMRTFSPAVGVRCTTRAAHRLARMRKCALKESRRGRSS